MIGNSEHLGPFCDTPSCPKDVDSFGSCSNTQDVEFFATPQIGLILSCLQLEFGTAFKHQFFDEISATVPCMDIADNFEPTLYYEAENNAFDCYRCFESCAFPFSIDPQTEAIYTEFLSIPNEWAPIAAAEYTEASNSFNHDFAGVKFDSFDESNSTFQYETPLCFDSESPLCSASESIAGDFCDASIQSLVDNFAQANSVSTKTPSEMRQLLDLWHLVNYIVLSPSPIIEGWTVAETLQCYRDFKGYTNLHLSQEIESLTEKASMDKILVEFLNGVTFENQPQ